MSLDIAKMLEEDNDPTLKELCQKLNEKYNVQASASTMCRGLQKTTKVQSNPKKKSLHATQAESLRVQTLRVKYWEQVRDVAPENLIFIDETGVNLTIVRTHRRAFAGKRAYGE
ncbi:MAG: hypothetical protein V7K89_19370 [Nostoc sp.]|uniref:hypothetical protein n=1 Tax=Nostoc sp. TaxID=1180 RepID=UPI002FF60ED4